MYSRSEKPLISRQQIDELLESLAEEIRGEDFDIILSALTGGFIFTADLCRRIACPKLQIAFIKASSYGNGMESSGKVQISGLESLDIKGKAVLVIDDILDSGRTMLGIKEALLALGPSKVKTCVLLDKPARRAVNIEADYVGFSIGNEFVVGYGLDYANEFRTYPEIWTMRETYGQ